MLVRSKINSAEHPISFAPRYNKEAKTKLLYYRMLHAPTSLRVRDAHHSGAEYKTKKSLRQEKF